MTFYIIDPSLRDRGGHHFEFDATIASAARSTGQHVVILAHKDCNVDNANGAKVVPWFSNHIYEDKKSVIGYGISNILYFNTSFYNDLIRFQKAYRLQPRDNILMPTLCEKQLLGLFRWAASFAASDAPLLIVYLMFSPDFWLCDGKASNTERVTTERALFYSLAFKSAATVKATVRVFAGGRQIAREFSALARSKIEAHPLPFSLIPGPLRTESTEKPTTLLYAGVAKRDKGFLFLSDLADRVSAEHPGHEFLIHVDFGGLANEQADMCSAFEKLKDLQSRRPNIVVQTGVLKREEYLAFIKRADCYVCTYEPSSYGRKTSGVVWEAISLGLPILAPANTFIQREAAEWGAGFATYSTWSETGISAAYTSFYKEIGALSDASRRASERFQMANNSAALADHLSQFSKATPVPPSLNMITQLKHSQAYWVLAWLQFRIRQKWLAGVRPAG